MITVAINFMVHRVPRGTTGVSAKLINEAPKVSVASSPVCNATFGNIDFLSPKQVQTYVYAGTISLNKDVFYIRLNQL